MGMALMTPSVSCACSTQRQQNTTPAGHSTSRTQHQQDTAPAGHSTSTEPLHPAAAKKLLLNALGYCVLQDFDSWEY
jgi:hypothetical protein